MENLPIIVLPLLAVCIFVACTAVWLGFKDRRFTRFAAAGGLSYQRGGQSPIAVPRAAYGNRSLNEMSTFLRGPWHGVEVFACNFRIGWGRGNVAWLFMVAVHAELDDAVGVDLKRWNLTPLNGWTFLIPKKPKGGTLNIRKVSALWDALTAAVRQGHTDAAVTI